MEGPGQGHFQSPCLQKELFRICPFTASHAALDSPCPAALPEENAGWSIILIIYLSSVYKFMNLQIYGSLIPVFFFFYLLIYI